MQHLSVMTNFVLLTAKVETQESPICNILSITSSSVMALKKSICWRNKSKYNTFQSSTTTFLSSNNVIILFWVLSTSDLFV